MNTRDAFTKSGSVGLERCYYIPQVCVLFVLAPKRCESIWSHVDAHRGSSFVCCLIVEQETP